MSHPDLTHNERHQILSVLQELDPSAPRENRRHARRRTLLEVMIHPLVYGKLGEAKNVILANVAPRGVAVLLSTKPQVGERFVTLLEFDDGSSRLTLCEVRNSRRLTSGLYKTGAQFLAHIDDATVETEVPPAWFEL